VDEKASFNLGDLILLASTIAFALFYVFGWGI
jgi:hypothetical protein